MPYIHYQGFTRPCRCEYVYGSLNDGQPVVIFKDGPETHTSITNVVEDLSNILLAGDLKGLDPSAVRFFEYYDPARKPLAVWQEVIFEDRFMVRREGSALKVILEFFGLVEAPKIWGVDTPSWGPVHDNLQIQLAALV